MADPSRSAAWTPAALVGYIVETHQAYVREAELTDGARRSTLGELTSWTEWAERTLVF